MMVSVLALTMEVSKGLMVTLSFSFTVSSNDRISRGQVVTSVQNMIYSSTKSSLYSACSDSIPHN